MRKVGWTQQICCNAPAIPTANTNASSLLFRKHNEEPFPDCHWQLNSKHSGQLPQEQTDKLMKQKLRCFQWVAQNPLEKKHELVNFTTWDRKTWEGRTEVETKKALIMILSLTSLLPAIAPLLSLLKHYSSCTHSRSSLESAHKDYFSALSLFHLPTITQQ